MCDAFFFGSFEFLLFEVLRNVNDRPHFFHCKQPWYFSSWTKALVLEGIEMMLCLTFVFLQPFLEMKFAQGSVKLSKRKEECCLLNCFGFDEYRSGRKYLLERTLKLWVNSMTYFCPFSSHHLALKIFKNIISKINLHCPSPKYDITMLTLSIIFKVHSFLIIFLKKAINKNCVLGTLSGVFWVFLVKCLCWKDPSLTSPLQDK